MIAKPLNASVVLLSALLWAGQAQAELPDSVKQSLKAAGIPADALSVAIVPLDGAGAAQYHLPDVPRNPASTMKLVTTWAGLNLLGPAWQWQTDLLADAQPVKGVLNSPIYLRGSGDPKLTLERMWLWVRDLKAAGVDDIRGPLVLDGSYFQRSATPGEFDDDGGDTDKTFLVEPDALMSNFRTQRITFDSTGERVILTAEPPLNQVRVSNQLALGESGNCATWAKRVQQRFGQVNGVEYLVQYVGEMPAGCKVERYVPVLNAHNFTSALFWYVWYQNGGKGSGQTQDGVTPAKAVTLASTRSPDLVSNIRDINKYSNNLMARQLYLTLGAQLGKTAPNTDEKAAEAIRAGLQAAGLNWPELVLENGAGLSRKEQVSARHLADLLANAWRSPYAAEYISSLPLVGIDGTMRKRLNAQAGMAHIKTGTLRDVRAAAGYVKDSKGRNWAVVAILNHPEAPKGMPVLDTVLRSVLEK